MKAVLEKHLEKFKPAVRYAQPANMGVLLGCACALGGTAIAAAVCAAVAGAAPAVDGAYGCEL